MKLIKWLIAPCLLPLVAAFLAEAVLILSEELSLAKVQWLLFGLGAYLIAMPLLSWRNWQFLHTFEHELGHMVVRAALFHRLIEFRVYPEGNENYVRTEEGLLRSQTITALAPYYLPVFALPWLALRWSFPAAILPWVDLFIGFAIAFHYIGLLTEFHPGQSDIQKNTFLYSLFVTIFLNVLMLMIVVAVVTDDVNLLLDYLARAAARARLYYGASYELIYNWWVSF